MLSEWEDYIVARKSGIKKHWKPLLEEQLINFTSLDGEELQKYIEDLCIEYFDNDCHEIPIQHPKIWTVVLNQWSTKLESNDTQYLMWAYKAISFDGVYSLMELDPKEILIRILEVEPENNEVKALLFQEHLNTLDFALHELPTGLVVDRRVCEDIIVSCERMVKDMPELKFLTSRFNCDYETYKNTFFSWCEYIDRNIKIDFYEWLKNEM